MTRVDARKEEIKSQEEQVGFLNKSFQKDEVFSLAALLDQNLEEVNFETVDTNLRICLKRTKLKWEG
jgi:hypothetical protein